MHRFAALAFVAVVAVVAGCTDNKIVDPVVSITPTNSAVVDTGGYHWYAVADLGGGGGTVNDLNENNQIVGRAWSTNAETGGRHHAFLWATVLTRVLATLGA